MFEYVCGPSVGMWARSAVAQMCSLCNSLLTPRAPLEEFYGAVPKLRVFCFQLAGVANLQFTPKPEQYGWIFAEDILECIFH